MVFASISEKNTILRKIAKLDTHFSNFNHFGMFFDNYILYYLSNFIFDLEVVFHFDFAIAKSQGVFYAHSVQTSGGELGF